MNFLATITIYLLFLCCVKAVDYCSLSSSLCPSGTRHIACEYKALSANCPKNAKMVNLKPFIGQILHAHNNFRNRVAGGLVGSYSPAANMATMTWNNDLAKMAAYNVKQCKMKHDKCRNTPAFRMAGQNLAAMYTTSKKKRPIAGLIKNRVGAWFKEWKNANMNIINSYPQGYSGPDIGHFTQAVNGRAAFIGCGAIQYSVNRKNYFLIGCDYSITNIVRREVYKASTKAATGCKTGTNPKYPNLCYTAEEYIV